MRFLTLTILSLSFHPFLCAEVFTVSNNPSKPAQFSSISDAISSASDNDTIYVMSSYSRYPITVLDKPLAIIGEGHDIHEDNSSTWIENIILNPNTSGTILEGIRFDGQTPGLVWGSCIRYNNNFSDYNIQNLLVKRCGFYFRHVFYLNQNASCSGWVFHQNYVKITEEVFPSNSNDDIQDVLFTNNIFESFSSLTESSLSPSHALAFSNNTFFDDVIFDSGNISITDNIFLASFSSVSCASCNITFNLIAECIDCESIIQNNFVNQTPIFENYELGTPFSINPEDQIDIRLAPSSVGFQNGSNGTDVGVFGGSYPMTIESAYGSYPRLPRITLFTLLNPVVGEGNDLEYTIEVQSAK